MTEDSSRGSQRPGPAGALALAGLLLLGLFGVATLSPSAPLPSDPAARELDTGTPVEMPFLQRRRACRARLLGLDDTGVETRSVATGEWVDALSLPCR